MRLTHDVGCGESARGGAYAGGRPRCQAHERTPIEGGRRCSGGINVETVHINPFDLQE